MIDFKEKLISIRRQIHSNPELGGCEYKTASLVEKVLNEVGVKTKRVAKTGVVGVLQGRKKSKKCVALRSDLDALPITERTGKSYSSKVKGVMHACGHDANTTINLGAAILLAKNKDFAGTIKFIFQPAEETSNGAVSMIKAGALRNPKVDSIVGVHVCPWLESGYLGLKNGEMMAAVDKFEIEIIGDGGHGAYPHLGKDAVVVASQVVSAIQTVVSREIDPVEPAVVTIGKIEGGERFNVLCGNVKMTGTVRSINEKVHREIPKLMKRKIKYIAMSAGVGYKLKYEVLGYPLRNSLGITAVCRKAGEKVLGKSKIVMLEKPSMGGEDFAEYLRFVPGCFVYFGTKKGKSYPWHHEKFDIDESALVKGAEFFAQVAREL